MQSLKDKVACAFNAADEYDCHAFIQQRVANELARHIRNLPIADNARILEIGCGTGYLGEALLAHFEEADVLMTDVAPAMLEKSRQRFRHRSNVRFGLLDGERPEALVSEAPFDLICSSLAVQWFSDLPGALRSLFRYLKPGGFLVLSTLAKGTFAEWIAAHSALGLQAGTPAYPTIDELRRINLPKGEGSVVEHDFMDHPASGLAFLRSLRAIGADTPSFGHSSLNISAMRKVIQRFETQGCHVTYRVAFCQFAHSGCEL